MKKKNGLSWTEVDQKHILNDFFFRLLSQARDVL